MKRDQKKQLKRKLKLQSKLAKRKRKREVQQQRVQWSEELKRRREVAVIQPPETR